MRTTAPQSLPAQLEKSAYSVRRCRYRSRNSCRRWDDAPGHPLEIAVRFLFESTPWCISFHFCLCTFHWGNCPGGLFFAIHRKRNRFVRVLYRAFLLPFTGKPRKWQIRMVILKDFFAFSIYEKGGFGVPINKKAAPQKNLRNSLYGVDFFTIS